MIAKNGIATIVNRSVCSFVFVIVTRFIDAIKNKHYFIFGAVEVIQKYINFNECTFFSVTSLWFYVFILSFLSLLYRYSCDGFYFSFIYLYFLFLSFHKIRFADVFICFFYRFFFYMNVCEQYFQVNHREKPVDALKIEIYMP